MNYLILIILFGVTTTFPSKVTGEKVMYTECPFTNATCGNVAQLAKYVSKCIGIVLCYQSLLTNPNLLGNYKLYKSYTSDLGTGPRICETCKERGQCTKNVNGKDLEWNGFKLYYYHINKTLEFNNDFYGHWFSSNFSNVTPLEFLKMYEATNIEAFKKVLTKRSESINSNYAMISWMTDVLFWYKQYDPLGDRKVYIGLHGLEGCEEEQPLIKTNEGEFISPVVNPKCSHYTKPTFYEKYSCHCGNPKDEFSGINKCCTQHRECINEIRKDCPSILEENYYISINMSKYHHELYRTVDNAFLCLDLSNDKCQEALCNCDRKVSECWASFPDPPNVNICISCYMDEARLFANEPIKALGSIQTMFENQIVKVQQLIKEGFTGNNNEIAVRMEVAVLATQLGQEEIEKIDRNFGKLFNETQDKAKQYSKTAKKFETEKRQSKAEAYFNLANYKITINNLAIVEYLKERRLTFNIEEKLFKEIHKLKDLLQL